MSADFQPAEENKAFNATNQKKNSDFFCSIFLEIWLHFLGRHDNLYNDTQHNDTQYNDTQHNDTQHNDNQHNDTQDNDTQHYKIQHNDAQHIDIEHNDIQYNDTQHKGIKCYTQQIDIKNDTEHNNVLPLWRVSLCWVSWRPFLGAFTAWLFSPVIL
jgi:hypothetical protein